MSTFTTTDIWGLQSVRQQQRDNRPPFDRHPEIYTDKIRNSNNSILKFD